MGLKAYFSLLIYLGEKDCDFYILPKKQNILPKKQNILPKKQNILPKKQNILPKKQNIY